MTLAVRVIATLLIDPARGVIKGQRFQHDRVIGEPIQWTRVMTELREVDEICVLDVTHGPPDFALFQRIVDSVFFIPLAYGGGIHDLETAARIAQHAEKIVIGDPRMLTAIAERVGCQAAVGVINRADDVVAQARIFVEAGAGELLLQSMEHDGMMDGYDLEMVAAVRAVVNVPIIASSGAGSPADCVAAIQAGADAIACGALYAFTDVTPNDVKLALRDAGYPVRLRVAA